jgi:hypothetical protein
MRVCTHRLKSGCFDSLPSKGFLKDSKKMEQNASAEEETAVKLTSNVVPHLLLLRKEFFERYFLSCGSSKTMYFPNQQQKVYCLMRLFGCGSDYFL